MLLRDLLLFLLFFLIKIMINILLHTEFEQNRIKKLIWDKYRKDEKDFLILNKGKTVQAKHRSLNHYHLNGDISIHIYHASNLDN